MSFRIVIIGFVFLLLVLYFIYKIGVFIGGLL